MYKRFIILTFLLSVSLLPLMSQGQVTAGLIGYYNVENLFDTIDTPGVNDVEFTPDSPKRWNTKKYFEKLDNLSRVIADIGKDEGFPGGPHVLGLSEVENREVIEDLVANERIAHLNYRIVHYNSPDRRGIDVALIYQPDVFQLTASKSHRLNLTDNDGREILSRDQLVVSGLFMGEKMHFIVNHWPSRRGGERASRPLRIEAAKLSRHIVDSLLAIDPQAKIVVMGDFNDDPRDVSLKRHLNAGENINRLKEGELYNTMYPLFRKGVGSLAYRDRWNLFDQIIISQAFLHDNPSSFRFLTSRVFNKDYLTQDDGRFRGYPFRTYVGDQYMGGYSDHFLVYMVIGRGAEKKMPATAGSRPLSWHPQAAAKPVPMR